MFVEKYARKRFEQAKQRGVERYGRLGDEIRETGVDAHVHGLLGEAAVVVALGKDRVLWNYFVDGSQTSLSRLPEIVIDGVCIDAKGISDNSLSLLVQAGTAKPDWAYVLVGVEHAPTCELIGWMWGHDVLRVELSEPQKNRPAHLVRQGDPRLLPFETFIELFKRSLFEHYCRCGKWGSFGYGVSLLKGKEGEWFCREHSSFASGART